MDKSEREFLEVMVRYCKGIRASTARPDVAEWAAKYEQYFRAALDEDKSARNPEVQRAA